MHYMQYSWFLCINAENKFQFFTTVPHLKHNRNKCSVIYLPQYQQAFIVLLVGMEALCEKEMLFVLDGAECSWAQGSRQCFTVVLTFKSSQGSCAELLKITNSHLCRRHSWPWTIIIAAHSDSLECTICTEPAQCTFKEKKQRRVSSSIRTNWKQVWKKMQTQSCLSEERTKALSITLIQHTHRHTYTNKTNPWQTRKLKRPLNNSWCVLPEPLPCSTVHNYSSVWYENCWKVLCVAAGCLPHLHLFSVWVSSTQGWYLRTAL